MKSIKQNLPTEVSLRGRLDEVWGDLTDTLLKETHDERQQMSAYQTPLIISGSVSAAAGLVLYFSGGVVALLVLIVALVFAAYYGYQWYDAHLAYTRKLNTLIYKLVFRFFDMEAKHFQGTEDFDNAAKQALVQQRLSESKLLTEDTDKIQVGDVVEGSYADNALLVAEVKATREEGSGKHRRTVTVFHGLFATFAIDKQLTGVTFISTEGDESGYGHRDFWGRITGKSRVEETELEWNDFERDLHVATSDGSEARYILSPDFMQDLHAWWLREKRNIRIVFRDNTMSMLLPDKDVKVQFTTGMTGTAELKDYAMTIIEPMWHVLLLLEDVDEQFR